MSPLFPTLARLLACPRCDAALDDLTCRSCQIDYPVHDGVPWLTADPAATRSEWRNRYNLGLSQLEGQHKAAQAAVSATKSRPALQRLRALSEGYAAQQTALRALLFDLALAPPAGPETYLALKTQPPARMGLFSYQANVHRDWCWGETENRQSLNLVAGAIPGNPERILILGAGAGRLAYDLHQARRPELTVAVDINPYLTTLLRKMANGESVSLTEFPLAPRKETDTAITRELKAPSAAATGFEVILADAMRAPFVSGSFDLVVTPWLIDVVDAPPAHLLAHVNRLLSQGGTWINHGSLSFSSPDPGDCINLDELIEIAAASGFGDFSSNETAIPYMCCPESRHARTESVTTLKGVKETDVPRPEKYQSLPDWIARGREPIPLLPPFQSQAMSTRIHAFIMTLIDGKRSLKDMAALMEEQQLMPREDAETAIRGFLIKMYEDARSGQTF